MSCIFHKAGNVGCLDLLQTCTHISNENFSRWCIIYGSCSQSVISVPSAAFSMALLIFISQDLPQSWTNEKFHIGLDLSVKGFLDQLKTNKVCWFINWYCKSVAQQRTNKHEVQIRQTEPEVSLPDKFWWGFQNFVKQCTYSKPFRFS